MKPANMAPMYVFLYPALAEIAREHGYALAIHGSIGKDFDLVAVPWAETVRAPEEVIEAIVKRYAVASVKGPAKMNHGRLCWTIAITISGECYLDLSFVGVPFRPAFRAQVSDATMPTLYANRCIHGELLFRDCPHCKAPGDSK